VISQRVHFAGPAERLSGDQSAGGELIDDVIDLIECVVHHVAGNEGSPNSCLVLVRWCGRCDDCNVQLPKVVTPWSVVTARIW